MEKISNDSSINTNLQIRSIDLLQDIPANHYKFLSYVSVKISLHLRSTANTDEFPKENSTSPSASEENKVSSILRDIKWKQKD